ncbi:MAG: SurA N-terminal domain-containing protein [Guyparkeria sp.]
MDIREKIRGWLAYVIVGLISIPFMLWGVGEYMGGGSDPTVAEVEGDKITSRELDRAFAERRAQMIAESDEQLTAEMFEEMGLKRQVLDEMINERLLVNFIREQGYVVPDERVAQVIRGISAFHADGDFDRETYERRLAQQGMSVDQFENDVRRDQLFNTLDRALIGSAFVTDPEVRQLVALRDQSREIGLIRIDRERVAQSLPEPDEDELRAYYEERAEAFARPEQVRLSYIEITPERLAGSQEISEEALASAYEDYKARKEGEEVKRVRHILVQVGDDADAPEVDAAREAVEEARDAIASGEASFDEMAAELSDDSSSRDEGGDLGRVREGDIAESFDRALASLEVGELSEPVRTRFGWHLIEVYDMDKAEVPPLEEARDELLDRLRQDAAERAYYDAAEELASVSYEQPDSLVPASEAVDLEVEQSDWISPDEGEGIGEHEAVRAAAFDEDVLEERFNSQLIELGSSHAAVVRVEEYREASPLPYEEVESEVREQWQRDAIDADLDELTESMRAALDDGGDPAEIAAAEPSADWVEPAWYQRGQESERMPAEVLQAAFGMTPPGSDDVATGTSTLPNGDRVVLRLSGYRPGEPGELDAETRRMMASQLESNQADRLIAAFMRSLRDEADVEIRERAIDE